MKRKVLILMSVAFFSTCTVKDRIDYRYVDKAEMTLNLTFSKGEKQEIECATIFIFDGNNRYFRTTNVDRDQIAAGVYETYLPNDRYTLITWANCKGNTVLPEFSPGDELSEAVLRLAHGEHGCQGADDLMYNRTSVDIVKGDSKRIDVDLEKVTYRINVFIENVQALDNPTDYFFRLAHGEAISFSDKSVTNPSVYVPELDYEEDRITGSFHVLQFDKDDPIQIGIYAKSSGLTLVETEIQRFLAGTMIPDLMSGKHIEIDIRLVVEETYITLYIDDFYVATVQREDLGN